MSTDGRSMEEYRRREERQHEQALEQQAHGANFTDVFDPEEVELLRELLKTKLDSGTIRVLDNYISPDFLLSNLREKDITKFEWQLETKLYRVFWMHPKQGGISGKARAYYYNDPRDTLEPLRPQDRAVIQEYKDGIIFRIRRSQGGFQQDKIGESTSRVETVSRDEDGDNKRGRIRGFLGR